MARAKAQRPKDPFDFVHLLPNPLVDGPWPAPCLRHACGPHSGRTRGTWAHRRLRASGCGRAAGRGGARARARRRAVRNLHDLDIASEQHLAPPPASTSGAVSSPRLPPAPSPAVEAALAELREEQRRQASDLAELRRDLEGKARRPRTRSGCAHAGGGGPLSVTIPAAGARPTSVDGSAEVFRGTVDHGGVRTRAPTS